MTARARHSPAAVADTVLLVGVVLTCVPIAWNVFTSFRYDRDITAPGISGVLTFNNYRELFGADSVFLRQFANSIGIVAGTTLLCLVIGSLAGYSLSKLGWSKPVTYLILGGVAFIQLIPPMTLVPGLYFVGSQFGILGSVGGLIVFNTLFNLPFAAMLMKLYFDQWPSELRESALIDGASDFRAFLSVGLPLVRSGLAAVAVFVAIQAWNEFLMGLTLTTGGTTAPVTVGIAGFVQQYNLHYGQMAAAANVAAVPIIILAVLANRFIVAGLTRGALK